MARRKRTQILITITLVLLSAVFLFPLLVTVSNSFMAETEIESRYSANLSVFDVMEGVTDRFMRMGLVPDLVSADQYEEVLVNNPTFLSLMMNSLLITVPVTAGNVIIATLTAFGFTVWRFKYKEAVFSVFIVVMLMPLQAVLVPNYIVADALNIKESMLAVVLPGIFSPFGIFLMRQSMKSIPTAYFEAAHVDGAPLHKVFAHVALPQLKSALAALAMLVFIEYWNIVEQAVIFIKDYTREPLSVFLSRIAEGRMGLMFAASTVYMLLPFWFLLTGQKNLEKGIELSGVK